MTNLNYLMDPILYRYLKLFCIYLKKHETDVNNSSIKIYKNKIENRITF